MYPLMFAPAFVAVLVAAAPPLLHARSSASGEADAAVALPARPGRPPAAPRAQAAPAPSRAFNTDYRTRSSDSVVPVSIQGRGLGGRNLPVGQEDSWRGKLPADFCPTDLVRIHPQYCYGDMPIFLRQEAAQSLQRMFYDASTQGLRLQIVSGYRDYAHQQRLYADAVRRKGKNQKTVARPGNSEHFLGTTADVTNGEKAHTLSRSFGDTREGRWLAQNAARYGWKMTVMAGNGRRSHNDEPWHIRYLGTQAAGANTQVATGRRPGLLKRIGRLFGR